jgi:hypothetical protein
MKILKYSVFLFILLYFPTYSSGSTLGSLRISVIEGDVQIRTEDTGEWVPASINMPLVDGDQIWVPEGGRTELQLRDGTFLRLDENSALEILTVEKDSFQFYLTEGRSYANFRGLRENLLQIDTPVSSIRAYERSLFRIDATPDGYTDISVYRGSVNAETRDGITRVDAGKTLSLREGTYAELSPLPPPDNWERWNRERDRKLAARRPPPQYLPEELYPYANDFEKNGRWVQVREYGYVWTPTVIVSVGWAPYRIGRWVWFRGDYVWVSYEPWGWVPYHYGRWAFVTSIGWCWVPPARGAVYWGPGFVGWVRTPTHVSWVPLAPGEIYYGHGHYGPHSINVTQVNITQINIQKVVYKNTHVQNAVTVVHHDTFVKGRQVEVKVKENPFLREKISIGRPDIKPERATVMPIIKEIPQTKRPPEPIREIKVKELKQQRPLVRERGGSVIKPGSPPKEMPLKVKEGKPVQREIDKSRGQKPAEKGIEKSREIKAQEKREKKEEIIKEGKPTEKGDPGKPKEIKPPEKGAVEKPKEVKPPERGAERFRESKPTEKGVEKPRPIEKEIEKPKQFKPAEKGVERPREIRPPERGVEKPGPVERGVEKPKEFKPAEKGVEKAKELKPPQKAIERVRESKPPEIGAEKPRPIERPIEKPKEFKPAGKGVEKPREIRLPEKGIEKPGPVEKGAEKSRERKPPEKEVQK